MADLLNGMRLSQFIEEDFTNYKKAAMFLGTTMCDGKCWREQGLPKETCQNHALYGQCSIYAPNETIAERYLRNPITHAIIIGGLEPLIDRKEVLGFIETFRSIYKCNDDIVIYTGYYEEEVSDFIESIQKYPNIYMKFGRYIPNKPSRFDEVLGVTLVSDNQYGRLVTFEQ